ncbi:hypothetical protein EG329_014144 [Mollisiaceae sp. DMI_Dod_QoI]|nr:hypothetical protein EG329_014144 [Helotiales sp. DMI_Dod_QoI]
MSATLAGPMTSGDPARSSSPETLETPAKSTPGPFELAIKNLPKDRLKSSSINVCPNTEQFSPQNVPKLLDSFSTTSQGISAAFPQPLSPSAFTLRPSTPKSRTMVSFTTSNKALFPTFKKLPIEIQLQIWNDAIADIGPRVVTLAPKSGEVPALLHACHDSRKEAKKIFSSLVNLGIGFGQVKGFEALVNYHTDIVFLTEMRYTREPGNNPLAYAMNFYSELLKPVKKLAIKMGHFGYSDFHRTWIKEHYFWDKLSAACPNIEELVFDLESLAYYSSDGSLLLSRNNAVKCFKDCVEGSLIHEQKEGRWQNLAVHTTTTIMDDSRNWECFSEGGKEE